MWSTEIEVSYPGDLIKLVYIKEKKKRARYFKLN